MIAKYYLSTFIALVEREHILIFSFSHDSEIRRRVTEAAREIIYDDSFVEIDSVNGYGMIWKSAVWDDVAKTLTVKAWSMVQGNWKSDGAKQIESRLRKAANINYQVWLERKVLDPPLLSPPVLISTADIIAKAEDQAARRGIDLGEVDMVLRTDGILDELKKYDLMKHVEAIAKELRVRRVFHSVHVGALPESMSGLKPLKYEPYTTSSPPGDSPYIQESLFE